MRNEQQLQGRWARGRLFIYLAAVAGLVGWRDVPHRAANQPAAVNGQDAARAIAPRGDTAQWVEMRNVDLHIDARTVMQVRSLRGRVLTTVPGSVAWLDKPTSFSIQATSGVVALDGDAITALLNEVAFNYPGAPIKHLKVRIEAGTLVQTGVLHKGVDIPFKMWAVPVLQPDGLLRLHPDRLRILGVNGLALMHALGLHLATFMDLSKAHGASVRGDDLYLDPLKIIPAPTVQGRLTSVRIEGDLLVQEFARTVDDSIFGIYVVPDGGSRNFVYFRGGTLRLGRLTMTDTDLLIHDSDESDPFDLYLAEYKKQLVAGHTAILANDGVRAWMVDYGKLGRAVATTPAGRRPIRAP